MSESEAFEVISTEFSISKLYAVDNYNDIYIFQDFSDEKFSIGLGINSITIHAFPWKEAYAKYFIDKNAYIVFGIHKADRIRAATISDSLKPIAKLVKNIDLPIKSGDEGNFMEYILTYEFTIDDFKALVSQAPDVNSVVAEPTCAKTTLGEFSKGMYYGKYIELPVTISGKKSENYNIPLRFKISCNRGNGKKCVFCGLNATMSAECNVDKNSEKILELIDVSKTDMQRVMRDMMNITCDRNDIEILEKQTIEEVVAIPEIDYSCEKESEYTARRLYYAGHGLKDNKAYNIRGYNLTHPKNQHSTILIQKAIATQGSLDSSFITPEIKDSLKIFRCEPTIKDIDNKLQDIYTDLAINITRICGREDILLAIDLTYHSALRFKFAGSTIEKGWIDALVFGDTQCGKCFVKDTEVLMYDGSIKKIQDVIIGDLVMGDDSTPRRVLSLARGQENMYEIVPELDSAEGYTVNESHIMCLKRMRTGKELDMNLTDYMKLSPRLRGIKYKCYKKEVSFEHKNVILEPYFLGMWLGDGRNSGVPITNTDFEVITWLGGYAHSLGMKLSTYKSHNGCNAYAITNGMGFKKNMVYGALKYYNLINNKHIPMEYKINSELIRLEVLAGIIDSDGHKPKTKYNNYTCEIVFKDKTLADDTVFLARSLGFRCAINTKIATIKRIGYKCRVYRIRLYGDLWRIPTKIARKQWKKGVIKGKFNNKPWLNYGFKIKEKGIGDYFGFKTDGNQRFLLKDFTVVHNSDTIKNIIKHYKTGEIIGGDSISYAGLVGGLQQIAGGWNITWGKLVLNNGRLLAIDEFKKLSTEDISNLASIRTTGIAEINKVQSGKTTARTRLLCFSNPRSNRKMAVYSKGILAMKELVGNPEDISRFDFALIVADTEIPQTDINEFLFKTTEHKYISEYCKNLVLWAWTRKKEDIEFLPETEKIILQQAMMMAEEYDSSIPLVTPAQQRVKLARMALSLATRLNSTTTGDNVVVYPAHAEYVFNWLRKIYNKTSMGYDLYSKFNMTSDKYIKDNWDKLVYELKEFPDYKLLKDLLLQYEIIRKMELELQMKWESKDIKDFFHWVSKTRLMHNIHNGYVKHPLFIKMLKELDAIQESVI